MNMVPRYTELPSREAVRSQIADEVEKFLSKGGNIDKISRPKDVLKNPPRPRPWMSEII